MHELISTLKAKAGIDSSNLPPKYSHERKIPPPPCHYECPVLFKFNRCSCFTYVFFSFVFRMVWLSYVHQVTMQRRTKPCKLARWKMIGTVGSCWRGENDRPLKKKKKIFLMNTSFVPGEKFGLPSWTRLQLPKRQHCPVFQCWWCFSVGLLWCSGNYLSVLAKAARGSVSSVVSNCVGFLHTHDQKHTGLTCFLSLSEGFDIQFAVPNQTWKQSPALNPRWARIEPGGHLCYAKHLTFKSQMWRMCFVSSAGASVTSIQSPLLPSSWGKSTNWTRFWLLTG